MCQYNKMFSHVYKKAVRASMMCQILEKLNNTTVIEIDQIRMFLPQKVFSAQSNAKALILAENTSGCIYEGAL